MDFKTRTTPKTPVLSDRHRTANNDSVSVKLSPTEIPSRSFKMWLKSKFAVIFITVLAVLLLVGGFTIYKTFFSADTAIKRDKFQALFLTNGQVYFGYIGSLEAEYIKVSNVFYLQTQQAGAQEKSADSQVTLTKLGSSELHGPEDTMYIAKSQLLFWENIKDDSKVVQAIKKAQK